MVVEQHSQGHAKMVAVDENRGEGQEKHQKETFNVWKMPIYALYYLLFVIDNNGNGVSRWRQMFLRILVGMWHFMGALTVILVSWGHIQFYKTYSLVSGTMLYYQLSMNLTFVPFMHLFLWISICTNKLQFVMRKFTFSKTLPNLNLKQKLFAVFLWMVTCGALIFFWFGMFKNGIALPPAHPLAKYGVLVKAIPLCYGFYMAYVFIFGALFLQLTQLICATIITLLSELKGFLTRKMDQEGFHKNTFAFDDFSCKFGNISDLVAEVESLFSFLFGMFLGISLNSFVCALYTLAYMDKCVSSSVFFGQLISLSSVNMIAVMLPAALVHSEVRPLWLTLGVNC